MRYVVVEIEDADTHSRVFGYGVMDTVSRHLVSIHTFDLRTARKVRDEHEEAAVLALHWPDARDPDVMELVEIGDRDETYAYRVHLASEKVARRRAGVA